MGAAGAGAVVATGAGMGAGTGVGQVDTMDLTSATGARAGEGARTGRRKGHGQGGGRGTDREAEGARTGRRKGHGQGGGRGTDREAEGARTGRRTGTGQRLGASCLVRRVTNPGVVTALPGFVVVAAATVRLTVGDGVRGAAARRRRSSKGQRRRSGGTGGAPVRGWLRLLSQVPKLNTYYPKRPVYPPLLERRARRSSQPHPCLPLLGRWTRRRLAPPLLEMRPRPPSLSLAPSARPPPCCSPTGPSCVSWWQHTRTWGRQCPLGSRLLQLRALLGARGRPTGRGPGARGRRPRRGRHRQGTAASLRRLVARPPYPRLPHPRLRLLLRLPLRALAVLLRVLLLPLLLPPVRWENGRPRCGWLWRRRRSRPQRRRAAAARDRGRGGRGRRPVAVGRRVWRRC